jgi:hypothetical protein
MTAAGGGLSRSTDFATRAIAFATRANAFATRANAIALTRQRHAPCRNRDNQWLEASSLSDFQKIRIF